MPGGRRYHDIATIGNTDIHQVTGDPNGVLQARQGSLAIDNSAGAASKVWVNVDGASRWSQRLAYDAIVGDDQDFDTVGAAIAAGATHIFVTAGTYVETGPITLPEGTVIEGEHSERVILDFDAGSGFLATATGTDTERFYDGGGTIDVTVDSTAVDGVGTTFQTAASPVQAGDYLVVQGDAYEIASVNADDGAGAITLVQPYRSPTEAGVAAPDYVILPLIEGPQISGMSLTNFDSGAGFVVDFVQCRGGGLRDVVITGSSTPTAGQATRWMLTHSVELVDCHFLQSGASATIVDNGWYFTVRHCIAEQANNSQLFFRLADASLPHDDHIIESCVIDGGGLASSNGIDMGSGPNPHARRARIVNNLVQNCPNVGIVGNTQAAADADGTECIVEGNLVRECNTGIRLSGPGLVTGNTVIDCDTEGIESFNESGCTIRGNLIARCATGIRTPAGVNDYVIVGNTIEDCTTAAIILGDVGGICHDNDLAGNAGDNGAGGGDINVEAIGADKVLEVGSPVYQKLDGGPADRNVDLPIEARGLRFLIDNDGGTNNLVVRNPAAATILTLTPGQSAWFANDGAAWDFIQVA